MPHAMSAYLHANLRLTSRLMRHISDGDKTKVSDFSFHIDHG